MEGRDGLTTRIGRTVYICTYNGKCCHKQNGDMHRGLDCTLICVLNAACRINTEIILVGDYLKTHWGDFHGLVR